MRAKPLASVKGSSKCFIFYHALCVFIGAAFWLSSWVTFSIRSGHVPTFEELKPHMMQVLGIEK
jgi:hypothetical protein